MGEHQPKSYETKDNLLDQEAEAFDRQIVERISHGHIPDLRRAPECPYFYNNTWRHPDYVQLDFGEQFEIILKAIKRFCQEQAAPLRILEVGCGPGYITLELARNGLDTKGLDLSLTSIEIAKKIASEDPWIESRGALEYICGDFLDNSTVLQDSFDALVFVGALHHFPDQLGVMQQANRILKENGIILVHEPTRDRMTRGNAAFIHFVQLLLSQGGGYFKALDIPESPEKQHMEVEAIYNNMRYESEQGEKLQSVNDNEAGFDEMMGNLSTHFDRLQFEERYAFFHELIGGLRFDQETNRKLAKYIRDTDHELCRLGVLQPTEFFYVGRVKGEQ